MGVDCSVFVWHIEYVNKRPLTKRQKEILDFICAHIEDFGYSPSYREIAENFDLSSVATIAEYINILEQKGYLKKDEAQARSIRIALDTDDSSLKIPLMGTIKAGYPIEAIRTNEILEIPRDMMGPNIFALMVKGDSMVDDGIMDGDYIIVEKTNHPKNGDIVVALLDESNVTLKRYYKTDRMVKLQPANSNYKPIYTKNVYIQGKVKGLIRKFAG